MHTEVAGQRFGRLTAVRRVGMRGKQAEWECLCDCGTTTLTVVGSLRGGYTKSCGCLRREMGRLKRTHGMENSPEYRSWCHMKERCGKPTCKDYQNYGGRGISVCERWRESFESFYADMGQRPTLKHTLERINSDGNYTPENCYWTTRLSQNRNRRTVRAFTLNGITATLQDWEHVTGVRWKVADLRLRRGWTIERALTVPVT